MLIFFYTQYFLVKSKERSRKKERIACCFCNHFCPHHIEQSYVGNQCTGKYEVKLALSISDTHTEKLSNLENQFCFCCFDSFHSKLQNRIDADVEGVLDQRL